MTTVTTIQAILLFIILGIRLCINAVTLINSIQSCFYDRKREKREPEQADRDTEYHKKRMKLLKKQTIYPQKSKTICLPIGAKRKNKS